MVLIVTALYCEAKPFIKHFNLARDTAAPSKFDIYTTQDTDAGMDMRLVVSGTGILRCAIATSCLLSLIPADSSAVILNTGICGTVLNAIQAGTPVVFNKIVNYETGRAYYPDMLIEHHIAEGCIFSFPRPVTLNEIASGIVEYVDMEAAGFMEAASFFLPPHKIHCIKVVSDHLDVKRLEPDFVSGLIQKNLPNIEQFIGLAKALHTGNTDVLGPFEHKLLLGVSEKLKLTVTMKYQLFDMARQYIIRKGENLDCLIPFLDSQVYSRLERRAQFDEVRKLLIDF